MVALGQRTDQPSAVIQSIREKKYHIGIAQTQEEFVQANVQIPPAATAHATRLNALPEQHTMKHKKCVVKMTALIKCVVPSYVVYIGDVVTEFITAFLNNVALIAVTHHLLHKIALRDIVLIPDVTKGKDLLILIYPVQAADIMVVIRKAPECFVHVN